jgi:hypothetical protein
MRDLLYEGLGSTLKMGSESKIAPAAATQEHSRCPTSDGQATSAMVVAPMWRLTLVEVCEALSLSSSLASFHCHLVAHLVGVSYYTACLLSSRCATRGKR